MKLAELTRRNIRLERVMARRQPSHGFELLVFRFEDDITLGLTVDRDTDELAWNDSDRDAPLDLGSMVSIVGYGLHLTWSWEMTNHQGYFDALQLELNNPTLARTIIFQIKTAASAIYIFSVAQE